MTADREWERVVEVEGDFLERIEVVGGWLYRSTQWSNSDGDRTESMTFVPDKAVDERRRERLLARAVRENGAAKLGGAP